MSGIAGGEENSSKVWSRIDEILGINKDKFKDGNYY